MCLSRCVGRSWWTTRNKSRRNGLNIIYFGRGMSREWPVQIRPRPASTLSPARPGRPHHTHPPAALSARVLPRLTRARHTRPQRGSARPFLGSEKHGHSISGNAEIFVSSLACFARSSSAPRVPGSNAANTMHRQRCSNKHDVGRLMQVMNGISDVSGRCQW